MRDLTGRPQPASVYKDINHNEFTFRRIYNLDDIANGTTYSKVLTTDISAGHILLSSVVQSADYRTATDTEKGVWNGKPDDLDELGEGTTYKRVLATNISSGRILLTAANYYSGKFTGEWYSMGAESGVDIDAASGINIYGKGNALTTRATKTGAIQCYVGSDGKLYAGAGKVELSSTGLSVFGIKLLLYNEATPPVQVGEIGYNSVTSILGIGSIAGVGLIVGAAGGGILQLSSSGGAIVLTASANPDSDSSKSLGTTDLRYLGVWTDRVVVDEIDPYQDTAKTVYFITKNKARDANLDHVLAPSVDLHGGLGDATHRWLTAHVGTITPGTVDFPTTDVTDCLDEDDMVSDSATKLATQQSIKAYVDNIAFSLKNLVSSQDLWWLNNHWLPSGCVANGVSGSGTVGFIDSYIVLATGTTAGSCAYIYKSTLSGYDILSYGWSTSYIEFFCVVSFAVQGITNETHHIVLGDITDYTLAANIAPHIGFKLVEGELYGTVGEGANESTLWLRTVDTTTQAKMFFLRVTYEPTYPYQVKFYTRLATEANYTYHGYIDTNLPAQTFNGRLFTASTYTSNVNQKALGIYEVHSLVAFAP